MRIPEVQAELLTLAAEWEVVSGELAQTIRRLVKELYRRPPVRRAPRKRGLSRAAYTPLVLAYGRAHPEASYMEIGEIYGINTGRVSEVFAEFRT